MSKRDPGAHARQAMLAAQGRLDDVDVDVVGILDVSGHPQPARGTPARSARRPHRLAFYMGYCPHRREDRVISRICPPREPSASCRSAQRAASVEKRESRRTLLLVVQQACDSPADTLASSRQPKLGHGTPARFRCHGSPPRRTEARSY
jgi:hypothetical protein